MARVSKFKIDRHLEQEMFKQFWVSLAKINDPNSSSDFFSDLLSKTEKLMLAKRFTAAILISRNKSATEIHDSIHLSYTTIASVSAWIKNAKPETDKLLKKISKEKNWEEITDKIEDILNKIKPRRHSN